MTVDEILQHFLGMVEGIRSGETVDRVIIGDGTKPVRRALVTWLPAMEAIRHAAEAGFDLVVTHEPTFYDHWDRDEMRDAWPAAREKRKLLEESGLAVLRIHDVWDAREDIGIAASLARFLGLGDRPAAVHERFYHRYDIPPVTLEGLAARIAERTALLGEPVVQVMGDPGTSVGSVGVGTGCICSPDVFQRMGCDVSIVCDDGTLFWGNLQLARDSGHPVVRINHGSSEDPGMMSLARYINEALPGVSAEHYPYRGGYRPVAAAGWRSGADA